MGRQSITKRVLVLAAAAFALAGCTRHFEVAPPEASNPSAVLTGTWRGELRITQTENRHAKYASNLWLEIDEADGTIAGTGSVSVDGTWVQFTAAGAVDRDAAEDTNNMLLTLTVTETDGGSADVQSLDFNGRWDGYDRILYEIVGDAESLGWHWLDRWSFEGPQ